MINSAFESTIWWRILSSTLSENIRQPADGKTFGYLRCPQVVRVRDKQILFPLCNQLIQQSRMYKRIVQVPVAWRVPLLLIVVDGLWTRQEGVLIYTGETRLVKHRDTLALTRVSAYDAEDVVVGVE